jgi:hypothetical protein
VKHPYLRFVETMALTWMQTVLTFVQEPGQEAIRLRALRNQVMKNMRHVILLTLMAFVTAIVAPARCLGSHGGPALHECCKALSCVCPSPSSVQRQPLPDSGCGLGMYASALVNGVRPYGPTLQTSGPLVCPYEGAPHSTQQTAITQSVLVSLFGSRHASSALGVVLRI